MKTTSRSQAASFEGHRLPMSCLQQLFAVSSPESFLGPYWPGKPVAVHGSAERFEELASLPELSHIQGLADVFHDPVMVILPDERDESSAIKVDANTALTHYRDHLALCFESVDRFSPIIREWLHALRAELGLPVATFSRALVYAARRGAGNRPHYDANANFVVQLRGTKRWTLAPNAHVENPIDRWTMTTGYVPPELSPPDLEMPRAMPEGSEVVDLHPGSVLFVPRGYWHSTEVSSEDTLALNFTYSQPTWAEVVTAVLLNRLHRSPFFRGLADGLEAKNAERQASAQTQLAQVLELFKSEVAVLTPEDLLSELQGTLQR